MPQEHDIADTLSKVDWKSFENWLLPLITLGATVIAVLIINTVIRLALRRTRRKLKTRAGTIVIELLRALSLPVRVAVWVVGLSLAGDYIYEQWTGDELVFATQTLRHMAIVLAAVWFMLRWNYAVRQELRKKVRAKELHYTYAQLDVIGKLVTVVTLVFGALVLLKVLGIQAQMLLTVGGFGTLAIGLAGRDVFANFFSGLMLYLTRPFQAGDRVASPMHGFEGDVEEVGWYLTSIRGTDKRPVYVPNALFSNAYVVNTTRSSNRQIRTTIGVRYSDFGRAAEITAAMREMLDTNPLIDQKAKPPPVARVMAYGESTIDIEVMAYTRSTKYAEYREAQEDVLLKCGEIIRRLGGDFAFPTRTIVS